MRRNQQGAKAKTSDPVIVPKPDLRQYRRRKPADTSDYSTTERRLYAQQRALYRPKHTRWRVEHGVVDQHDDEKTYTGECQRNGCSRWFAVTRPARFNGEWPKFCSGDCQDIHDGTRNRRNSRRKRAGETKPARRAVFRTFDAANPPAGATAWEHANELVDLAHRADESWKVTPSAYADAVAYLDECAAEVTARDEADRLARLSEYE